MTAASEEVRAARGDLPEGSSALSSPMPALERITVLLRHMDTQLAAARHEVASVRRLSVPEKVPDLDRVLSPLESVLGRAADTLGIEPAELDGRRALRGALHILWADLVDMSPGNLRKHWGVHDIPEHWPELHIELLAAVEEAISQL
jgi:hypothetical protein